LAGAAYAAETTPVSLYDRVWDVDYVTLQKGGIRNAFLSYQSDLRVTDFTFDLSAYPSISRVLLYTSHRVDMNPNLSFKVNGEDVSAELVSLGEANGKCWQGSPFVAYRLDKKFDCETAPKEFAITDIPANAIVDGFSLVVIYNDGDDMNNRDLTILNGNDVNFGTGAQIEWSADVFVNPEAADDVKVDLHIADVEWRSSEYMGSIFVNGVEVSSKDNPLALPTAKLIDSEYWDVATFPVTGLTAGAINTVSGSWSEFVATADAKDAVSTQDCQALVAVVVSTPTWNTAGIAPVTVGQDGSDSDAADDDGQHDTDSTFPDGSTADVSGSDNSGSDNSGSDNSGSDNSGSTGDVSVDASNGSFRFVPKLVGFASIVGAVAFYFL